MTTSALYDAEAAVTAAIDTFGRASPILAASRGTSGNPLCKTVESITDPNAVIASTRQVMRQTGADRVKRNDHPVQPRPKLIQLVLIGALITCRLPFHQYRAHVLFPSCEPRTGEVQALHYR